jgi:hypothetical protein
VDGADGGEGERVHGLHFCREKSSLRVKKEQKFDEFVLLQALGLVRTRRGEPPV